MFFFFSLRARGAGSAPGRWEFRCRMVQTREIHSCVCVCVCLQTLAGGDGGRSHGDGSTGASSGAGVSDLRGRSRLSERTKHGGAEVSLQTARERRHGLQVSPSFIKQRKAADSNLKKLEK